MELHIPAAQPKRLSASKMRTWMTCSLQAHFQYDQKLPRVSNSSAVFGNAVHSALAVYNTTEHDPLQASLDAFNEEWDDPQVDVWTKGTSFSSLRERGFKMLRDFHEKMKWEVRDVLAVEHSFIVPFGDYELIGIVDCVELRQNDLGETELRITDYKTNKKQPYITGLPFDVQFTAYVYAALQREFWTGLYDTPGVVDGEDLWDEFGRQTAKAYWFHLETTKEIFTGARKDDDFMRLLRVCQEIDRADQAEVYVPNLSGDSCGFCPFQVECGLPVPQLELL